MRKVNSVCGTFYRYTRRGFHQHVDWRASSMKFLLGHEWRCIERTLLGTFIDILVTFRNNKKFLPKDVVHRKVRKRGDGIPRR